MPPSSRRSPSSTRPAADQSRPAPTMEDVAREAAVGRMTVSRVLNNPDTVSPDTRAAVLAAIARLGYVQNLNAGSLASRRSRIIGAVIPTIANPFFSDTVQALSQTLSARGYQLLLGESRYRPQEEAALIDAFLGRQVDGILLIRSGTPKALQERFRHIPVPVVEAWEHTDTRIDMMVGFSNRDAGAAAARFLAVKGYRHLAYMGSTESRSSARLAGFRAAARRAGLPEVEALILDQPGTVGTARTAFPQLLARAPQMDAVFCSSDMLAVGVLFECQRRRLKVPQQIAVMGFADLPIAQETFPALTTVRVPSREIGIRAGEMLLARLEKIALPDDLVDLGFEIVERESA